MSKVVRLELPGRTQRPLADLVEEFLADIQTERKSPETVRGYGSNLRAFLAFFQGSVEAITLQVLRDYLRTFEGRTPATLARHRAALSAFLRWCLENELVDANPADRLPKIKLPDAQPRALTEATIAKVLTVIEDKRDRLLFQLVTDTGVRISEALSVRLDQIRLGAQEITVIGKGNRERTVYLIKTEALRLLRQYLRAQGWLAKGSETITERGLLFRPDEAKQRGGKAGEPIHYSVIEKAWRQYCQRAGVDATIHQLRHSYATRLINEGKPVEVVQKVLGHRNLATTQRYAVVSDETVRRALES